MPPQRTPHAPAAEPAREIFDPWNSSATGHQRADNRLAGSTSWRASRTAKLAHQYKGGPGGGKRVYDSVGAGSEHLEKDGRLKNGGWEAGAARLREKGCQDVRKLLAGQDRGSKERRGEIEIQAKSRRAEDDQSGEQRKPGQPKKIFRDLRIYINGSTAPAISDHKLKYLLAENGAGVSIALGRRSVTHVILGTPNGSAAGPGAGGGLAASKIQKEIKRVGGCGVKYVGVEWVLESIKAGKRLPEARFSNMSIAPNGQKSVYGIFQRKGTVAEDESETSVMEL